MRKFAVILLLVSTSGAQAEDLQTNNRTVRNIRIGPDVVCDKSYAICTSNTKIWPEGNQVLVNGKNVKNLSRDEAVAALTDLGSAIQNLYVQPK